MRSSPNTINLVTIFAQLAELRQRNPGLRMREAAQLLQVSELELLVSDPKNQLLDGAVLEDCLQQMAADGIWMWLARTEGAVLEVDRKLQFEKGEGFFMLSDDTLRIKLLSSDCMHLVYTVQEKGSPRSLQLFDNSGVAVLKIYLKDTRRVDKTDAMLQPYFTAKPEQMTIVPAVSAWTKKDEIGDGQSAPKDAYRGIIENASLNKLPLEFSLANNGCEFSVSVQPRKIVESGPWFNILDRGFNLHLREDLVANCRVFERMGFADEWLFYDADGETILRICP